VHTDWHRLHLVSFASARFPVTRNYTTERLVCIIDDTSGKRDNLGAIGKRRGRCVVRARRCIIREETRHGQSVDPMIEIDRSNDARRSRRNASLSLSLSLSLSFEYFEFASVFLSRRRQEVLPELKYDSIKNWKIIWNLSIYTQE
jgi:hypothetical protein